jgi:hypothetical protein
MPCNAQGADKATINWNCSIPIAAVKPLGVEHFAQSGDTQYIDHLRELFA